MTTYCDINLVVSYGSQGKVHSDILITELSHAEITETVTAATGGVDESYYEHCEMLELTCYSLVFKRHIKTMDIIVCRLLNNNYGNTRDV